MLNPRSNRLNYGRLLQAPYGYKLRNAICTTYSLDLETLMAAGIALGLNEETDTELRNSPINNLHALRSISSKLVVFCEAGQIFVPQNVSSIMSLLEQTIVEVALGSVQMTEMYPSFHPKTWLLVYESEPDKNGQTSKQLRFVVTSRNLTKDRSWDVCVCIDGQITGRNQAKAKPLVNFVSFLKEQIKERKSSCMGIVNDLLKVLPYADLKAEYPFEDFEILPLGIQDNSADFEKQPIWSVRPGQLVVFSPFLSSDVVQHWNEWHNVDKRLVTRSSELDKIRNQADSFYVYTLRDEIVNGEDTLDDFKDTNGRDIRQEDLHAKMYYWYRGTEKHLYLGSMNASYRGMHSNCEMMVCLKAMSSCNELVYFWKNIAGDENDDKKFLFNRVDFNQLPVEKSGEADYEQQMMHAIKRVCRLQLSAIVEKSVGEYNIRLSIKGKMPYMNIEVCSLLAQERKVAATNGAIISGLQLSQLSEFYVIEASYQNKRISKVIKIHTTGIPIEERNQTIIESIIENKHNFSLYVSLVLAGKSSYAQSQLMEQLLRQEGEQDPKVTGKLPALYEQLLRASYHNPEQIDEIAYLVDHIKNKEIITDEFRNTFENFRLKKKRVSL